jgi:hypothetical protein
MKTRMSKNSLKRNDVFIQIANIIVFTVGFCLISIITIGAGHGTTIPSKIIFPYAYLAISNLKDLDIFVYILALIQIPIYGIIYYNKPKYMKWLFVMHIIATIFVLIN